MFTHIFLNDGRFAMSLHPMSAREYARNDAFLRRWTGKLPDRVRQAVDLANFDLSPPQPVRALRRIEGETIDGNDFTVGVANASGPFQALQARVRELEGRNRELQGKLDESERGKHELRSMLDELRRMLDDQQQLNRQLTELVGITRASPAAASDTPPRVAAALPHTEVKADQSKMENDAARRVQASVRKHQAEADYEKQKLQAETERKRLLQAMADEEPVVVVQEEKTQAGVQPDQSKMENDAARRVQASVRKHQAEADYEKQKLQAETERKRLLQAMAHEEAAVVVQKNMRMVDAQKQRKVLTRNGRVTAERDGNWHCTASDQRSP